MLQVLVNGVFAGLTWGLAAVGFAMVYRTARFVHVGHAAVCLAGAYGGLSLLRLQCLPVVVCGCGGVVAGVLVGLGMELLVYRPLRKRGAPSLVMFLASLAVVIVAENVVALVFGSEIEVGPRGDGQSPVRFIGAWVTKTQCMGAAVALVLFLGAWAFTGATKLGMRMRAVGSNPDLATVVGIDTGAMMVLAMGMGSGLAAASGVLVAFDTAATPTMAFPLFVVAVAAAIVGGIGSVVGAMLGGLLVGVAQHVGAWVFSVEWQDVCTFAMLVLFLVVRPQGLLGHPLRQASV